MDTSEQYIRMRLTAIPDMGMGEPPKLTIGAEPEWLALNVYVDEMGNFYYSTEDESCQLERQDQLQEMLGDDCDCWDLAYTTPNSDAPVFECRRSYGDGGWLEGETAEQALLRLVMLYCHNKVWNGDEWVSAEGVAKRQDG